MKTITIDATEGDAIYAAYCLCEDKARRLQLFRLLWEIDQT